MVGSYTSASSIFFYTKPLLQKDQCVGRHLCTTLFFLGGKKKRMGENLCPCAVKHAVQTPVHNVKLNRGNNRETISVVISIWIILIITFQGDRYRNNVWKSLYMVHFARLHLCSSSQSKTGTKIRIWTICVCLCTSVHLYLQKIKLCFSAKYVWVDWERLRKMLGLFAMIFSGN